MGKRTGYQPHKLVIPVLFANPFVVDDVDRLVADEFGLPDSRTKEIPFVFTDYYDAELGPPVTRVLYSISELVDPSDLAALKLRSNAIEADHSRPNGTRTLNLDPGLLSLSRLILATTKPASHRIPIGFGIHAEITLLYRHGGYVPLEWTYPDFRSDAYTSWLLSVRQDYRAALRQLDPAKNWRL